jgi:hypothetical protein
LWEVAETLSELAFDLAQRAVDHQESTLEDVRTRAGTLLTVTALVATFLGARALDGAAGRTLAVGGVALAIGSIVLCIYVLAPRRSVYVAISEPVALAHFVATDARLEDAYVILADWLHGAWESNQLVVDRQVLAFRAGAAMLVGATCVWSIGLAIS